MELVHNDHCDITPGFLKGFVGITALLEPPNLPRKLLERNDPESVTEDIFKQAVLCCNSPEVLGVLMGKSKALCQRRDLNRSIAELCKPSNSGRLA